MLGEAQCLALLAESRVGHLALIVEGQPFIFPVNYVCDGNSVVVRTNWSALTHASLAPVALEIDGVDVTLQTGWSVLVQGVAHDVTDALDLTSEHLQTLTLSPWAPGPTPRLLRIVVSTISGQSFGGEAVAGLRS